ncbi:MAG: hypothetical protein U0X74_08690 [Anaerolineales bacterium]
MLNEEWIKNQIAEARKSNPKVTDAMIEHVTELFKGQLTKQQLTPTELKNISIAILQEMGFIFSETGQKK